MSPKLYVSKGRGTSPPQITPCRLWMRNPQMTRCDLWASGYYHSPMLLGFGILLTALLGVAYAPTFAWLWGRWQTDPFYSHGPLVPVLTAFLLWSRRARLRL